MMRYILVFAIISLSLLSAGAQSLIKDNTNQSTQVVNENSAKNTTVIERVEMGKSSNIFSVLFSFQRCMYYDEYSNTILGSFRADPATYPDALGIGTIMSLLSSDLGQSWSSQIAINPDENVHALRYPSGVIYNPNGEANVENAYVVAAGPSHTGGTWDFAYFGTAQLNNSNANSDVYYFPREGEDDWARSSMTVVSDAVYLFGEDYTSANVYGIDQTMKQYVGTTNNPANGFSWQVNTVSPDWKIEPQDERAFALFTTWSAWSRDGSIGYMWMVGVTNESYSYGVYQPQVYYTTNGGSSWNYIELNLEDHPVLVDYLAPSNGSKGTVRPSFMTDDENFPGVVDFQGNLHLFSNVFGSSKGDVLDSENENLIDEEAIGGHVFDFVIDQDGISDIKFIDEFITENSEIDAFGNIGWNHRLQASKSLNEKVVFAVWNDDDNSSDGTLLNPDIYAWAYNVETGYCTEAQNFTGEDVNSGYFFFPYVAELTPLQNGFYHIPVSTSLTREEFEANDEYAPVTHQFVSGIGFDESDIGGSGAISTQISVTPEEKMVNMSETFNTTIEIDVVNNLGGFELEIDFDPNLLHMNSVSLGSFLGSTGRTTFPLANNIDNSNGLLEYAVTTLGSSQLGPTGNGVLLNIEWTASSNITEDVITDLILQNVQITSPSGSLIPVEINSGQVNIQVCYIKDFDCDCDIDIIDVTMVAYTYGTNIGDPNYNPSYDLDEDGDIDIIDVTMVTYEYGWTCSKSNNESTVIMKADNHNVLIGSKENTPNNLSEDVFTFDLFIENVEQFGGFEAEFAFDTEQIQIIDIQSGDFIEGSGRDTFVIRENIDLNESKIYYSITTLGSQIKGAKGDGNLLSIKYKKLVENPARIKVSKLQLVRIDAEVIPFIFKSEIGNTASNLNTYIISSYPSPFKDKMNLQYNVGAEGEISFKMYNVFGAMLRAFPSVYKNIGIHKLSLEPMELTPGVYILVLEHNKIKMDSYRVIVK